MDSHGHDRAAHLHANPYADGDLNRDNDTITHRYGHADNSTHRSAAGHRDPDGDADGDTCVAIISTVVVALQKAAAIISLPLLLFARRRFF
jgi:hypothetical protein